MKQHPLAQGVLFLAMSAATVIVPALGNCEVPTPGDSLWSRQWNMKNTGQAGGVSGTDIGLLGAWEFTTGSTGVTVAIMRDAADAGHPDFVPAIGSARIVPSGAGEDHGTLIAGIIAAEADNGGAVKRGIAGIDQHCAVWCYKNKEWPNDNSDDIRSAADNGVDVVNYSYAEPSSVGANNRALAYAYNRGVLMVAPVGNDHDGTWRYPASFKWTLGVGGVRVDQVRPSHSNYGPFVDIVAPDGDSLGTPTTWITSLKPSGAYDAVFRTSYACPHVVGAASLLKGAHPELSNDDIASVLKLSALDIGAPGRDDASGHGLLKIDSAFWMLELPNKLVQWSGQPSIYEVVEDIGPIVANLDGISGPCVGDRYELRRAIVFEKRYHKVIGVWGRGSSSLGFYDTQPLNLAHNTEIVPGTP